MANHRMFANSVISSDRFLNLPPRAQMLYINIGLNADDDGFTNRIQAIRRSTDATPEELKQLVDAGYVYVFPSGIAVDLFWNVNNSIRRDRYKPTIYQEEMQLLTVEADSSYSVNANNPAATTRQPNDSQKTIERQPINDPATTECQPSDNQMYAPDKPKKQISNIYQENIQNLVAETDSSNAISQPNDNPVTTTRQPNDNQTSAQDKVVQSKIREDPTNHPTSNNCSSFNDTVSTNYNVTRVNARAIEENSKPDDFIPDDTSLHPDSPVTEEKPSMVGWMDGSKKTPGREDDTDALFQGFMKEYPRPVKMQEPAKAVFCELVQKYGVDPCDLIEAAAHYTRKVIEEKTMERWITMPQNFLADMMWVKFIAPTWKNCPMCHGEGYYNDGQGMVFCGCTKRYSDIPKLDNHMR